MFRHLLESAPSRQRTRSATVISFALHAALVGSAVAATAVEVDVSPTVPVTVTTLVYPRSRQTMVPPARPASPTPTAPSPTPPIMPPVEVPTTLPPVPEPGTPPMDPWTTLPTSPGSPGGSGDPTAASGPGGDIGPMWPEDVARHAMPLGGVRAPRYPEPLRTRRLEGIVVASFVVDTLGRVEPASFKARESAHALFEQAVRTAVMSQRFRPAEWNGHRVRQLVEQQFVFRLGR